jgi:small GTP-binding protein
VKIVNKSHINELLYAAPAFSFLKNMDIKENDAIKWKLDMNNAEAYCIQVIFIGKTGYGKSTTLNKICGRKLFNTDDINSCTRALYSSEYKFHDNKEYYISLCDLPGMGESAIADKQYTAWYSFMLKKSYCVVYILRADQRDFTIDENIINGILKKNDPKLSKLIVAVNYADKIEPVSRSYPFEPSYEQTRNLESKIQTTSDILEIPKNRFVYYSATEKYNFDKLIKKISNTIEINCCIYSKGR